MEGIVTMTMTGPYELSSPSSKFFSICSKFPDVPLFRPNSFIEDNLRARRCHSAIKTAKESFVHCTVGNLPCYLHLVLNPVQEYRSTLPCSSLTVSLCWKVVKGTVAWRIPWTEKPGRLQSMGLLGVGHD